MAKFEEWDLIWLAALLGGGSYAWVNLATQNWLHVTIGGAVALAALWHFGKKWM